MLPGDGSRCLDRDAASDIGAAAAHTIPDAWDVFTSSSAVANGTVYVGSMDGILCALG